jgi:hypothetical protein
MIVNRGNVPIPDGKWMEVTLKSGRKFAGMVQPDSNYELLHLRERADWDRSFFFHHYVDQNQVVAISTGE